MSVKGYLLLLLLVFGLLAFLNGNPLQSGRAKTPKCFNVIFKCLGKRNKEEGEICALMECFFFSFSL